MTAHTLGVEIACDGPDEARDCPESAAVARRFGSLTAVQVRADSRADGWTRRRRGSRHVDLCPACKTAP
ncbi:MULTISPECIES: hypothetical protein [unclassified Streptomyces]|uniref:hypothetical protein n=1 Tax=unclassified Streptomyces TaxID=2593676 RepID=UPI00136B0D91|nr:MULTISPECIES: hypothetical protein [unclassified Streptomyces]NDZ98562.1 hypothetical protein [Streptomyces sp. SID10116]MYY79712.1 hypothetical protein [Streptomyces sp. SID335]MYZ12814.1 hypothetical protein [Streptomyces sp. SID337]NDZ84551.1 hypothetical protein [Streptomyces sp. SID10115]NEB43515.1 hypothetical protein [Streptomyces sp. SID339]